MVDGCHELAYFLISKYDKFKAITGVMERDLHFKFYHSVVADENDYVIDIANGYVMKRDDYFMLNEMEIINEVSFEQVLSESEESKAYDESGTLYDLLRNALYKEVSMNSVKGV